MKRETERQMGALIRRDADTKKYSKLIKAKDTSTIKKSNEKYNDFNDKALMTVLENKLKTARVDVLNLKTKLSSQNVDINKLLDIKKEE